MSIVAGKLLTPLISPLGLALLLWVAGALLGWAGRQAWGRCLRLGGCLLLVVLGCPLVGERLLHRLEAEYPLVPVAASPAADAIVVLGGFTKPPIPPRLTTEVDEGFDRLLHGMRLWRAGKAPLLVLSGGNIPYLSGSAMTEAASLCSLAVEYGVPR
ncbi:MAG: YdcF family protein, partial [Candidatus Latescibacteria bacterium]|nr:YdcF family protein [Candidatus Latescibacterota bacterium]